MASGIDDIRTAFDEAEDVAPAEGLEPPNDSAPPNLPPSDASDPEPLESKGAALPLNDTGNGLRFALYCGDDAMFVPRVGWHVWDGRRWKLDPDNIMVRRLAQTIHQQIPKEIPHLRLKSAEKRRVQRLARIEEDLKALARDEAEGSDEDKEKRRTDLLAEKDKLHGALWGKGSTRARHLSFATTSGNTGRVDAALKEGVPHLNRDVEDLDADKLTVNTESGVLRFDVVDMREDGGGKLAQVAQIDHARTFTITGRNRAQYITKLMPVEYDPHATCPGFDRFLERVQPDPEMRAFLQRWFGLSMTAIPIQKFLYCYGMGANGKSLLAGLMRRMLGDYATMVKIESLTGKNRKSGSDATPDLMRLIGARAAITNEPEEGEQLQEQKIKEMTGGDEMLVRTLHADFVAFTPYFKLTFTGNHKLVIRGTDDGIWRRPLLCPFDVQIPEAERDEKLGDRLFETERSGILNFMIAGLIDYLERGLMEPPGVLEATEEYRKDSDPIGDFLANGCEIDGGDDWLTSRELVDACYLYLLETTSHAWRPGNIQRKLKDRATKYMHPVTGKSYAPHKRVGLRGYCGIRLTPSLEERVRNAPRDPRGLPQLPKEDGNRQSDDAL